MAQPRRAGGRRLPAWWRWRLSNLLHREELCLGRGQLRGQPAMAIAASARFSARGRGRASAAGDRRSGGARLSTGDCRSDHRLP